VNSLLEDDAGSEVCIRGSERLAVLEDGVSSRVCYNRVFERLAILKDGVSSGV